MQTPSSTASPSLLSPCTESEIRVRLQSASPSTRCKWSLSYCNDSTWETLRVKQKQRNHRTEELGDNVRSPESLSTLAGIPAHPRHHIQGKANCQASFLKKPSPLTALSQMTVSSRRSLMSLVRKYLQGLLSCVCETQYL